LEVSFLEGYVVDPLDLEGDVDRMKMEERHSSGVELAWRVEVAAEVQHKQDDRVPENARHMDMESGQVVCA